MADGRGGDSEVVLADLERGDERLRVRLRRWQGRDFVDVRVFNRGGRNGDLFPSRKGISLRMCELVAVAMAFDDAIQRTGVARK